MIMEFDKGTYSFKENESDEGWRCAGDILQVKKYYLEYITDVLSKEIDKVIGAAFTKK